MLAKRGKRNGCVEVVAAKLMRKRALRVTFERQVKMLQVVLPKELGCSLGNNAVFHFPAGFVVDFCREVFRGWYKSDEPDYAVR